MTIYNTIYNMSQINKLKKSIASYVKSCDLVSTDRFLFFKAHVVFTSIIGGAASLLMTVIIT